MTIIPTTARRTSRTRQLIVFVCVMVMVLGVAFWRLLPDPLFDEPLAALLLARDGSLLSAQIATDDQWRFPPLTRLPPKYRQALLLYEDKRFEQHIGVDPLAIGRAIRSNLRSGRRVSGASTLTMQLARLARAGGSNGEGADRGRNRGYDEKLVEMLLAVRLELAFSKEQILALYGSHAPFGGNVVGLEAAAWRYFGHSAQALSWSEAALLAVLPNSPALVNPGRNRHLLQEKRNRLLRRLRAAGALSALDLDLALAEPLPNAPMPLPNEAPHLLQTLRSRYPDEFRFETNLDPSLQRAASQMVLEHARALRHERIGNVAALIIDNQTFQVLAYVGNAQWSTRNDGGLAVDIVQRPRSTGSVLKPFLYAAMLDAGLLLPHMLVPDVPTQYSGYVPENFDHAYRGAVPADVALAQSLNVPAVRSLKEYGVERFYDLLHNMGMSTLTRAPGDYGLTLILGGAEGTLWDISAMYANLADTARRGTPGPAVALREPQILRGPPVHPESRTNEPKRLFDITPGAAWLAQTALLQAQRPTDEAHWMSFASGRKIAWKTGTSWGSRDAWAIGNTSRYTVAVWVGNASGEGRPGLTGSTAAAPLMFQLHARLEPAPWFAQPTLTMRRVEVCRDDGFPANDTCERMLDWVPAVSHFDRQSPYHQLIHLDGGGHYRVDSSCERVSNMRHATWFILPPAQEFYYRRGHADYRELPAYRSDCSAARLARDERPPMELLYPSAAARIYIPVQLDGKKGRTIFEAVHRDGNARLYWHLDGDYVGSTATFHQMSLDVAPGHHLLTLVDAEGNRLSRAFEVLVQGG